MQTLRIAVVVSTLGLGCDGGDDKTAAASKAAEAGKSAAAPAKAAAPAAPAPAKAGPAPGTERGPCYGNGTCNEGLQCLSDLCVKATGKPVDPETGPRESETPPPVDPVPPATTPTPFDSFYVGSYGFGVNRVNDGKRNATATIHTKDGHLELHATVKNGPHDLTIDGAVQPVSKTEFIVHGKIAGTPDLGFAGTPDTRQETTGKFTFRATKGRKFWRLYEVDGTECVCTDGCGNDFCYVDVGPKK